MRSLALALVSLALSGCNVTVATNSCTDGLLDGNETDVDCGGSCVACGQGEHCNADGDCGTGNCTGGICVAPVVTGLPDSSGATAYSLDDGQGVTVLPGTQAGYGITGNTGGSYRAIWTGDAATSGTYREFTGTIWTTGHFDSFTPGCGDNSCPLEANDHIDNPVTVSGGEVITFDTFATDGLDGLDFTVTGTDPVYFDLLIEGQRQPTLIFFPSNGGQTSPATDPFGLSTQ